jgi:hypothetical protein
MISLLANFAREGKTREKIKMLETASRRDPMMRCRLKQKYSKL